VTLLLSDLDPKRNSSGVAGVALPRSQQATARMSDQHETPTGLKQKRHEATDVRQGEIILRTPLRRAIFIGGLVAMVLLPLIVWLVSR
jgi:hypothetical protein